jgi:hypothetical protein
LFLCGCQSGHNNLYFDGNGDKEDNNNDDNDDNNDNDNNYYKNGKLRMKKHNKICDTSLEALFSKFKIC